MKPETKATLVLVLYILVLATVAILSEFLNWIAR